MSCGTRPKTSALFTRLWWENTWWPGQLWALVWRSSSPPVQRGPPLSPLAPPRRTGSRAGGAGAGCGRALRTLSSWRAPGKRGRLPRCGLPARGPSCADLPGIRPTRGIPWGTRRWLGALTCWCGLSSPCCCLGCSWEGLSPGWCPQSCHLSPGGQHSVFNSFSSSRWQPHTTHSSLIQRYDNQTFLQAQTRRG